MRKTLHKAAAVLMLAAACVSASAAPTPSKGTLIPPPAINIPFGGRIVSEINISDQDLLKVVKQIIPQLGTLVSTLAAAQGAKAVTGAELPPGAASAASSLDFKTLAEALGGIKNVRVVAALYSTEMDRDAMLRQIDAGAAKTGSFTRIMSDVAMTQGMTSVYAQAENAGYLAFQYDPKARILYACRVVGAVDVEKITQWALDALKLFVGAQPPLEPGVPETTPSPALEPNTETQ